MHAHGRDCVLTAVTLENLTVGKTVDYKTATMLAHGLTHGHDCVLDECEKCIF